MSNIEVFAMQDNQLDKHNTMIGLYVTEMD